MAEKQLPNLPKGWKWKKLSQVTTINPVMNYKGLDDDLEVSFVPMSAVDALKGEIISPEIDSLEKARKGHTKFQDDDVIFARITPCMENGKIAVAKNLRNGLGFGSTEFFVFRSKEVVSGYLFYYLRQKSFRNYASKFMTSTVGQLRVPKKFLENADIPFPPYDKQLSISKGITKLLKNYHEIGSSLKSTLHVLKRLKWSILLQAFEGKLTTKKHNDESSSDLLSKIKKERKNLLTKELEGLGKKNPKINELRDFSPYDYPNFPNRWLTVSLETIAYYITNGATPSTFVPENFDLNGIPLLKIGNVLQNGEVILTENQLRISKDALKKQLRSILKTNDVLMNVTGPPLGKIGLVPKQMNGFSINQGLVILRLVSNYNPKILWYLLRSPHYQDIMKKIARGDRQLHIRTSSIGKFPVPIIPKQEQTRILEKIDENLNNINKIESNVLSTLDKLDVLDQSILSKAFSGEIL